MANEFTQLKAMNGTFEARGVIFNMKSEHAFKEITMKNGKKMRMANIGLRISDGESMFLSMNGMEQEFVYFSKVEKGQKTLTEKVEWAKKGRFNKEGYRLIGVGLALSKEDGKNVATETFTQFDAVEHIQKHLEDGVSVFVKGKIEFGSYEDSKTKEIKKTVKYVPNAIYLTKDPIDFQSEGFKKDAGFAQLALVNGIRKEENTFYLDLGLVGYKSYDETTIEATEVLAKTMKEKIKIGSAIVLTGDIKTAQNVEVVTAEVWGEESKVGKAKSGGKVVMFATGARPETMDNETYAKKPLAEYLEFVEGFKKEKADKSAAFDTQEGGTGDWGAKSKVADTEDAW